MYMCFILNDVKYVLIRYMSYLLFVNFFFWGLIKVFVMRLFRVVFSDVKKFYKIC